MSDAYATFPHRFLILISRAIIVCVITSVELESHLNEQEVKVSISQTKEIIPHVSFEGSILVLSYHLELFVSDKKAITDIDTVSSRDTNQYTNTDGRKNIQIQLQIRIEILRHIGLLEVDEDKIRKIRPKGTQVRMLYVPREAIRP